MIEPEGSSDNRGSGRERLDTRRRTWLQGVAIVLVVALGITLLLNLIDSQKAAERIEPKPQVPLVHVRTVRAADVQTEMRGRGVVGPKVAVEIVPEVAGKVVFVHSGLKAGGTIPAHERIIQIDPRAYELAMQQGGAAVAEAQARLDIELAEADLARRQWRQQHPENEPASPLVLREPQIRLARAVLKGAQTELAAAQLQLERTSISLPYDVLIVEEDVDLGGYVDVGRKLATAYGIDAFEIEVSFGDDAWSAFDLLPDANSTAEPVDRDLPAAKVEILLAGEVHSWSGYLTRMTGQGDPATGHVPVVIDVPRPLDGVAGRPPLLPGMLVEVSIPGRTLVGAIAVPRSAIDDQNRLWLVEEGRLHGVPVEFAWTDEASVYMTTGLSDGAVIAANPPPGVREGMPVRIAEEPASASKP